METARFLAGELGERQAGSAQDQQALEYLRRRLIDLGLKPEVQRFVFKGWRSSGPGSVRVEQGGDREIAAVPLPYTLPTETGGARGSLSWEGFWPVIPGRLVCQRFGIRDAAGELLAAVLATPFGEARPLPNIQPLHALPTVVVGAAEGERLRTLTERRHPPVAARVLSPAIWEGALQSANLIVEQPGARRWVTAIAHYDSVERSPGANDNASGAALLLRLIGRLADPSHERVGLRFIFCGAEEPFLVGARWYIVQLATAGRLEEIAGCLNFDMVAVGERFSLRRPSGSLWETAAAAIGDQSPGGLPIHEIETMPSSDHWAFHEAGIASAQLTREPDPAWHSPEDLIERFAAEALDDAEAVAVPLLREFVEHVDHEGRS